MAIEKRDGASLTCSFCGKAQKEVKKLIAGPTVYICDGCVQACVDALFDKGIHIQPAVNVERPIGEPTGLIR